MVQTQDQRSALLPNRHEPDFFVCDIFDAVPKADMASMAFPIFSLSTKPDRRVRRYEHNGNYIDVKPSSDGVATVHDRDVLIYCISQLMVAINQGKPVSQVVRFKAHDLLKSTNRMTNGQGYAALKAAFERLAGTRISTNIVAGGHEEFETFGIIERAKIVRETREGRMQEIEVKLSDWIFGALRSNEVLTLNRSYFRLRKPIERRLYELARKHCGRQPEWRISLNLLREKCGSGSTLKEFKRLVGKVIVDDIASDHLPDYSIRMEERGVGVRDIVVFRNRGSIPKLSGSSKTDAASIVPQLEPETYNDARLEAPGWDIHYIEREWRSWIEMMEAPPPKNADAAFIGFCRRWFQKRGPAI